MERLRKPWEGVWNIVRFNWHFYAGAVGAGLALVLLMLYGLEAQRLYVQAALLVLGTTTAISLLASFYVYDLSSLYTLAWLENVRPSAREVVVNIHAGFDETSRLLRHRFSEAELVVLDFYDAALHTEVSIRRARKAYPAFPGTQRVETHQLPLAAGSADWVFIILAAHEIRQPAQREVFFREVHRILKPTGRLVVVEHLRDPANFMAYTIGFFHFYSNRVWKRVFEAADLRINQEKKLTPFVSAFMLSPRGNAS